jgi:hypothetical protein
MAMLQECGDEPPPDDGWLPPTASWCSTRSNPSHQAYGPIWSLAIAIVAVLQFLGVWNDLFTALLFLPQQVRTISVGLASLQGTHVANTNAMIAGSILSAIPSADLPAVPAPPHQRPDHGSG